MLSQKYLPGPTALLTQIQKEDQLKLLKLLIKSRKQKVMNHRPRDPIESEVYVGWEQDENKKKMKRRIKTEVQLGEKSSKFQSSFRERDYLNERSSSNLHSKSVQLPYLSNKNLKNRPKDASGRVSDFVMYKPEGTQKFEPTRTHQHQQTEKMKKKLIKVVERVYKDSESNEKQQSKRQKAQKNTATKKLKLEQIKKTGGVIPKHMAEWHKIDILKLETYFIKLLYSKQHGHHKNIEVSQIRGSVQKIHMPKKQKIPDYIREYEPLNPNIDIDELVKNPEFKILVDDQQLYFGCVAKDKRSKTGISICNNSKFEGEWVNDNKYEGYEITTQGYYKGKFKDGMRHGQGIFIWKNGEKYEGEWRNGSKHGSGIWKSQKGDSYIGQWNQGKVEGYGVHISANGQRYEGNFQNFLKHGQGKQSFPNGDLYEGSYKAGKPSGKGKYTWKNQIIYEGQFIQGYRHGKGVLVAQGYMKFIGNFVGDKPEGQGQILYKNGDSFIGHFKEGERNGKGTMKYKNSHQIITGIWKNNEREELEGEN